jgi:hypothetical protein
MFEPLAHRIVVCAVLLSIAPVAHAQTSHEGAAASTMPSPPKAMVVVIPTRSNGGPNLSKDATSLVEVPLARSATIVSYATYKNTVLAAGHNQKDVADINTIRSVATAAGITHAVVVEGSTSTETENGKSVKVNTAEISLIDAATGAVIYTTKRTLTGTKLTRSVSTPVVAVIAEKLSAPPPAPPPQPEPPVPVVPVPPPPVAEQPPPPPPDRDGDGVLDDKDACPDVAGVATERWETNGCPPLAPKPVEPAPPPIAVDRAPVPKGEVDMNPTLSLRLGVLALGRDAKIGSTDGKASYTGPLVAPHLQVAYFPFAKHDAKRVERGVGIYGEGYLTGATSHFKPVNAEHTSTVGGFEVGGALRFPLTPNDNAPVITLQLGYAYGSWPLSGVIFPGTHYSSPEIGFVVDAPVAKHVALFVGGKFMPWMSMGSSARLLGRQDGGYAVRGELGVRFQIAPFELALSGRYTQYNADFVGVTRLGLASELGNVNYVDRYYGGLASLGYSF